MAPRCEVRESFSSEVRLVFHDLWSKAREGEGGGGRVTGVGSEREHWWQKNRELWMKERGVRGVKGC
jgi:hypothetical protein